MSKFIWNIRHKHFKPAVLLVYVCISKDILSVYTPLIQCSQYADYFLSSREANCTELAIKVLKTKNRVILVISYYDMGHMRVSRESQHLDHRLSSPYLYNQFFKKEKAESAIKRPQGKKTPTWQTVQLCLYFKVHHVVSVCTFPKEG